jgi:hypothetical protein
MILKWFIRTILTLLVLSVSFCIIVVIINLHDEPPSEDALYLDELYQKLPDVADENNAYLYLLGLDANVGEAPLEIGLKRHSFSKIEDGVAKYDWEADRRLPTLESIDHGEELERVMSACHQPYATCKTKLAIHQDWTPYLNKSAWFVKRYQQLILFREWRNIGPADINLPLPAYSPAIDGQKLYLMSLQYKASAGDNASVKKFLSDDLLFWRMVLASSDNLIEKMIATAAIRNHFFIGNIVLSRLPPEVQLSSIPDSWGIPLSVNEYGFDRALLGEHRLFHGLLSSPYIYQVPYSEDSVDQQPKEWQIFLSNLIYKEQATANIYARRTRAAINRSRASDIKIFSEVDPENYDVDVGIYNYVGRVLAQIGGAFYDDYYRRVADIEGFRRSSLAIAHIRAKQLPLAAWADFLQKSEYRDPYTEQAFGIDAERKALIFVGLGKEPNKIFYAEL